MTLCHVLKGCSVMSLVESRKSIMKIIFEDKAPKC